MKDSLVNQRVIQGIQNLHSDLGLELARDNVAKAYMGQWGGRETIEKLRRRVHWIARQVKGNRVLDVGTSEGILPILLGREGFEVVGIDINGDAIDYAKNLLSHEDEIVRERVHFFKSSLYQDQPTPHFDTVVLGEILEHLTAVGRFIARAIEHLKDDGTLVITTPFGVFPDPDHKTTFYLSDLIELLRPHGTVEHLSVDDGYIRTILRKTASSTTHAYNADMLLNMTEVAAHEDAVRLHRQIDDRDKRLANLKAQSEVCHNKLADATAALASQKQECLSLDEKRLELEEQLGQQDELLRSLEDALQRLTRIEGERETLHSALEQANNESAATEQSLKVELATTKTELSLLRERKAEDQVRLDKAEQETKEQRQEVRRLQDALDASTSASFEERERLLDEAAATDAERRELRGQIEQSNQSLELTKQKLEGLAAEVNGIVALRRENNTLREQIALLTDRLASSSRSECQLAEQLKSAGNEIESLAQALHTLQLSKAAISAERDQLTGAQASLRAMFYKLSDESTAQLTELEGQRETLSVSEQLARKELADGSLRNCAEGERYRDQLRRLEIQLSARQQVEESLQAEIAELTTRNAELHNKLAETMPAFGADGSLVWVAAVRDLLTDLPSKAKPREIANTSTSIAKSKYHGDPLRTLILAAIANDFDPKPYREKWLGFCLAKNGLMHAAYTILRSLPDDAFSSASEERLLATTKRAVIEADDIARRANSSSLSKGHTLRAISALDEFSEHCWSHELGLERLSRNNYEHQISCSHSHFFFAESAWRANDRAWEYAFTSPGLQHRNAQDLLAALKVAKKNRLPSVFWNKEDPLHFERFLPIARDFDVILTTDSNSIERYRSELPDKPVFVLPFAAQPKLHNPADRFRSAAGTICFAGSYFTENHDERRTQMDALLPVISQFDGVIYDRMSAENNSRYDFPKRYSRYIRQSVPFNKIVNVYRQYRVFLNVNTITNSPSMMSRRVYELLACGTPVLSSPSRALEENFSEIVITASSAKEATPKIERLLSDEDYWHRISHLGYRKVMQEHTYENRRDKLRDLMCQSGIILPDNRTPPLVSLITTTCRPHMIDRLVESITCQSHSAIESIIITQNFSNEAIERLNNHLREKNRGNLKSWKIIPIDTEKTLGERLNIAVENTKGEFISKIDDDDFYLSNYISDMIIPFKFSDASIVGKKEIFMWMSEHSKLIRRYPGSRHRHTDFITGATMVFRRSVFDSISFEPRNQGEDSNFIRMALKTGLKLYATDPYNFICFRGNNNNHTWKTDDEEMISRSEIVGNTIHKSIAEI